MFGYVFVALVGGGIATAVAGPAVGVIAGLVLVVAAVMYDQAHS